MSLYKEFLVVENGFKADKEFDINQIFDFVRAIDITNATKVANSRGYNIPKDAIVIDNTLHNINTVKLSVISTIINNMLDNGLDDNNLSQSKQKLKQIKRLVNQVL